MQDMMDDRSLSMQSLRKEWLRNKSVKEIWLNGLVWTENLSAMIHSEAFRSDESYPV